VRKRGSVDSSTDFEGSAPETEVAAWWDNLSDAERARIGDLVYGKFYPPAAWQRRWDELLPMGQQMHLHMHYDSAVRPEGRPVK
jgi:hypothetical protein